jgi:VWFA-related protein
LRLCPAASAQQSLPVISPPGASASSGSIRLDVVVNTKSGQPVINLAQQDFTILDNKSPRPITSFKVVTPAKEPVEVILFIDAVNTPFSLVAYMRDETEKFLKANEGTLAYPTTFAVLTDDGVQTDNDFSTNGNLLSDSLEHHQSGLRQVTRSSQWGGVERLDISLKALHQLVDSAAKLPGRKIILWISPGWPLLSGPDIIQDSRQEQHIFSEVVSFSSQLRQAKTTLYNINPVGATESLFRGRLLPELPQGPRQTKRCAIRQPWSSGAFRSERRPRLRGKQRRRCSDREVSSRREFLVSDYFRCAPYRQAQRVPSYRVQSSTSLASLARTRTGYYSNTTAANPGR